MITGVVLARNEEAAILGCLETLQPHVEELILIDMESTDRTAELARPLVSQILTARHVANFDASRNLAIDVANHNWLWFLDADERVPQATGQLIRQVIGEQGQEIAAITIPFKTYFCGKWIEHSGWWPGYTMPRVLKRGHFRFREPLHAGVEVSGPQVCLPPRPELAIEHYSYQSIAHYVEKFNRYTSTEAQNRQNQGAVPDWKRGIREMVRDLWLYYERNAGHRDGLHGWILAWLAGQYRWMSEAKLLDLCPTEAIAAAAVPADLDEVFGVVDEELGHLRGHTPKLPLQVNFRSPLLDPSGYADDGRTLLKGLALTDRRVSAEEIRWSDLRVELPAADLGLIRTVMKHSPEASALCLTNCIPTLCGPDPKAVLNVLRTTFETDRIPSGWHERLAAYDEIWVCSEANRTAFRRGGVAPERLHVLPQAIDGGLFSPNGPRLHLPAALAGRFVFLCVLDWQWRKGWDCLLRAYAQEFSPDDGVGLLLKISRAHGHSPESVLAQASSVLGESGQSLSFRHDIVLWDALLSAGELAALYRAADAFVLASRGEGWGRPYLEAMACGLPPIIPRGGPTDDFADEETAYFLEAQMVPCEHEWEMSGPATQLCVDLDDLRRLMRSIYERPQEVLRKGEVASRRSRDRFTWQRTAGFMMERIQALAAEPAVVSRPFPVPLPPTSRIDEVATTKLDLSVCLAVLNNETTLADCLSRIQPFVEEIVVGDLGSTDRSIRIAQEYGAKVYDLSKFHAADVMALLQQRFCGEWMLQLEPHMRLSESAIEAIAEGMRRAGTEARQFVLEGSEPNQNGLLRIIRKQDSMASPAEGELSNLVPQAGMLVHGSRSELQARRRTDPNPASWAALGEHHFQLGNFFHAECYLTEALAKLQEGKPLHRRLLALLIECHLRTGDPYRAAEFTERFKQLYPQEGLQRPLEIDGKDVRGRLYLGAGKKRLAGYMHADLVDGPGIDVVHDLDVVPWPWEDSSADLIVAEDVVEHLAGHLVEFCNEAWRVLRPDGELFIRTPHHAGVSSWIDPTHRWHLHEQSIEYLDPDRHWGRLHSHYTDRKWEIVSLGVRGPQNILAVLIPRK